MFLPFHLPFHINFCYISRYMGRVETFIARQWVAVLAVAAVVFIRLSTGHLLGSESSFILFPLAVALAAVHGGFISGAIATELSVLAIAYFFTGPDRGFNHLTSVDVIRLLLFTFQGMGIAWLISRLRVSFHRERLNVEFVNNLEAKTIEALDEISYRAGYVQSWDSAPVETRAELRFIHARAREAARELSTLIEENRAGIYHQQLQPETPPPYRHPPPEPKPEAK